MQTEKKIIPFSLDAWKAGGRPVTRDGQEVKSLTHFESSHEIFNVFGVVNGSIEDWTIVGEYKPNAAGIQLGIDLMLEVQNIVAPDEAYTFMQTNSPSSVRPTSLWSFHYETEQQAYDMAISIDKINPIAIYKLTKIRDL